MNDLDKMEIVLKINDAQQRLVDLQDKQNQQINDLIDFCQPHDYSGCYWCDLFKEAE